MFWFLLIIIILVILYILHSLVTIKHQLQLIIKHLNIKEVEELDEISNEEIEKILEDDLNK